MDIRKQNLHSSWIRNMLTIMSVGLVLIAYFKKDNKLKEYLILPISFIIIGLIIGSYSIYYTYYTEESSEENRYAWKHISVLLLTTLSLITMYIIKVL